jgi:hypothetical protein
VSIQARDFINPSAKKAFIMLNLSAPDGNKVSTGVASQDFEASTDRCYVRLKNNVLEKKGDVLHLKVAARDCAVDLEFTAGCPSWKPGCGKIHFDDESKVFGWNVNMPGADVKGRLIFNGSEVAVQGIGYHDHNFGNISMAEFIPRWYWGRFQAGKYTGVYADVFGDEGFAAKHVRPFFLARPDKIVLATDQVDFINEYFTFDPETKRDFPSIVTIKAGGETPVAVKVFNSRLMESRFLPKEMVESLGYRTEQTGRPVYIRMSAECLLQIPGESEQLRGKAVHEITLLR